MEEPQIDNSQIYNLPIDMSQMEDCQINEFYKYKQHQVTIIDSNLRKLRFKNKLIVTLKNYLYNMSNEYSDFYLCKILDLLKQKYYNLSTNSNTAVDCQIFEIMKQHIRNKDVEQCISNICPFIFTCNNHYFLEDLLTSIDNKL